MSQRPARTPLRPRSWRGRSARRARDAWSCDASCSSWGSGRSPRIGHKNESSDTVHYLDMSDKSQMCLTERVPPRADPRFERPTREHALQLARETFQRGERVDMQTLATQLGVVRSTLYRWVGDREQLL